MKFHPVLTYTLGRLTLVALAALVLGLLGFRGWPLAFGALVASIPLSWVILRRQRGAFAEWLVENRKRRAGEKARLRKTLEGE